MWRDRNDLGLNPVFLAAWILVTIFGLAVLGLIGWGFWTLIRWITSHA